MAGNPEAQRYLAKARESLASAEVDYAAKRYNSCANRSYYAAFQAAVALLIELGWVARGGTWDHRFVIAEFSGKLVKRRKVLPSRFVGELDRLLAIRVTGDYRPAAVSRRAAGHAQKNARDIVGECAALIDREG